MESDIERIKEIFSSKREFLGSVFGVRFVYRRIVDDSGYVNYLDVLANYEADNDSELEYFYFAYKAREYDNFEIDSVEKEDSFWHAYTYRVEMHKEYRGMVIA